MKSLSPAQSLFVLVLVGVAIAGWAYGFHWKRVVSGDRFSADEMMTVRLQDQIEALTEENKTLNQKLREAIGEAAPEAIPATSKPLDPSLSGEAIVLPSSSPVLPAGPQKIETH